MIEYAPVFRPGRFLVRFKFQFIEQFDRTRRGDH